MPEVIDDQATPEVDVDVAQDPVVTDPTDPEPAKPEEPFLPVNERTVYRTKDEAVRGFNEAASRIKDLSAWEKQAKEYGLQSPAQLKAIADELLDARKQLADAKKAATTPKVDQADPKAKETEQVRKYLKDLGYISKEDQEQALNDLKAQFDELKQAGSRSEELRFQNQEAEARDNVTSWLKDAGIKDDATGTKLAVVGTLVKDWVNSSEERMEQWSRGGISAKSLIKEGFDFALKALDWKGSAATTVAAPQLKPTDPGYAAAKAKALANNKKLPASGTANTTSKTPPKQRGHINAELHEKAWEMFREMEK